MGKRQANFRLSEAARLKLDCLVEVSPYKTTATRVLEELILGAPDDPRDLAAIVRREPEGTVRQKYASEAQGGVKRHQTVPKPGWKK